MVVIAAFAWQTTASTAISPCNCPDEQPQQVMPMENASMDMPCHEMAKADAASDMHADGSHKADCEKCGCGHCTVTKTVAWVLPLSSGQALATNDTVALSEARYMKSIYPHGIDYPPKRLS